MHFVVKLTAFLSPINFFKVSAHGKRPVFAFHQASTAKRLPVRCVLWRQGFRSVAGAVAKKHFTELRIIKVKRSAFSEVFEFLRVRFANFRELHLVVCTRKS